MLFLYVIVVMIIKVKFKLGKRLEKGRIKLKFDWIWFGGWYEKKMVKYFDRYDNFYLIFLEKWVL